MGRGRCAPGTTAPGGFVARAQWRDTATVLALEYSASFTFTTTLLSASPGGGIAAPDPPQH